MMPTTMSGPRQMLGGIAQRVRRGHDPVRPTWDEVAVVAALLIPAAGYVFAGLTVGVVLLCLAIALMIALWTPVRGWLGISPHASRGGVSAAHRSDLQTIAEAFNDRLARERTTVYVSEQRPLHAQAFRTHFPDVAQMLDTWDALVGEIGKARAAVWDWEAHNWRDRASPAIPGLVVSRVAETGGNTLPWTEEAGYLMLPGVGMLEIKEGVDRAKFKQPYDEFLADALASNQCAELRRLRLKVDEAKQNLSEELELIRALSVIRGRCDLCA
jgi:hypothetical protein